MKLLKWLAIVVALSLAAIVQALGKPGAIDYCSQRLTCFHGKQNVACKNEGNFAKTCPPGARLLSMQPHIYTILHVHNENRNELASGEMPGYRPATRMATMQWDNELATTAEFNVKKCNKDPDVCHRTSKFFFPGQNIGLFGYSGNESEYTDTYLIMDRINYWWSEYTDCNMDYIRNYPMNYSGPSIGRFTVMASDENINVGCAVARWFDSEKMFNRFMITCNYSRNNWFDSRSYQSGLMASKCTTGRNPYYKNLCSAAEQYATF